MKESIMGVIIFLVLCLNVIGMMHGTTASSTMNATADTARIAMMNGSYGTMNYWVFIDVLLAQRTRLLWRICNQ